MPFSKKAKYLHKRQRQPRLFEKKTFKTVPISHTDYSGKYQKKGNKAIVGRLKKTGEWKLQSILVLKQKKSKR